MAKIFISPFSNNTNEYIEVVKSIIEHNNSVVEPLSIKSIFSKKLPEFLNRKNTFIFHWVENRIFKKTGDKVSISLRGTMEWLIFFLLIKISPANSIYFIHNHAVHDSTAWIKWLSSTAINAFAAACKKRIVHDPTATLRYRAIYLPHPLYQASVSHITHHVAERDLVFGLIGAIRPYKNIDAVLSVWPAGSSLRIRGYGPNQYVDKCKSIINEKKLSESVSIDNKFLSTQEFSEELEKLDVLILPHKADSMLVSGAFFEAIGRTRYILARRTPFIEWASNSCESIICFNLDNEIPDIIKNLNRSSGDSSKFNKTIEFANAEFGWDQCRKAYKTLTEQ